MATGKTLENITPFSVTLEDVEAGNVPSLETLIEQQEGYKERKKKRRGPERPVTPEAEKYKKQFRQPESKQEQFTGAELMERARYLLAKRKQAQRRPYGIGYEEARGIYWELLKGRIAGKHIADGNFSTVVKNLVLYFIGDPNSPYPLTKGVYLWGAVGVGKSRIMEAFSDFTQCLSYHPFDIVNVEEVSLECQVQKTIEPVRAYRHKEVFLDDIFADKQGKIYGNTLDVSRVMIEQFYRNGWEKGERVHVTSNIPPGGIKNLVPDAKFTDRCNELFTYVNLTGKSKRTP